MILTNEEEFKSLISGTKQATSITKVDKLTCAVCGFQKSGKSYLVAKTCRKPLLHYDFDNRAESIAGTEGVTIKTIFDIDSNSPKTWGILETDIGALEYLKQQGKLDYKSICLDSFTFLRQFAENQMMLDSNLKRTIKVGTIKYQIAQGYDAITSVQKMLQTLIRRIQALEIDLYCNFHVTPEKDKARSTRDNAVYTEKWTVEPNNLAMLLSMFNEVWRTYIDQDGNYKIQTKADYYFNANTSLSIDAVENASIEDILKKHQERYGR